MALFYGHIPRRRRRRHRRRGVKRGGGVLRAGKGRWGGFRPVTRLILRAGRSWSGIDCPSGGSEWGGCRYLRHRARAPERPNTRFRACGPIMLVPPKPFGVFLPDFLAIAPFLFDNIIQTNRTFFSWHFRYFRRVQNTAAAAILDVFATFIYATNRDRGWIFNNIYKNLKKSLPKTKLTATRT